MWAIIVILALLIPLLAVILDSQVGRALAQRLERGRPDDESRALAERLERLEGELERLSDEVHRLGDEGRFLHDLLTERSRQEGKLPPGEQE